MSGSHAEDVAKALSEKLSFGFAGIGGGARAQAASSGASGSGAVSSVGVQQAASSPQAGAPSLTPPRPSASEAVVDTQCPPLLGMRVCAPRVASTGALASASGGAAAQPAAKAAAKSAAAKAAPGGSEKTDKSCRGRKRRNLIADATKICGEFAAAEVGDKSFFGTGAKANLAWVQRLSHHFVERIDTIDNEEDRLSLHRGRFGTLEICSPSEGRRNI